jgi:MoxR-like ATPase
MPSTTAPDVFDLLNNLQGVQQADVHKLAKVQATKVVTAASKELQENPWLIEPRMPDYIDGMAIKAGSHTYSMQDVKRMILPRPGKRRVNVGFFGPAGTGKTAGAFFLSDLINMDTLDHNKAVYERNLEHAQKDEPLEDYKQLRFPLYHTSCHDGTRSEDLTIKPRFTVNDNGDTVMEMVMSDALTAYSKGGILIIEEWDMALPGVWSELHAMFEASSKSVMFQGKQYVRHDDFVVLATGNTRGKGENDMAFAGTQVQNSAFQSRFRWFPVNYLPAHVEVDVLTKNGLRDDIADIMVECATKIRKAASDEEFTCEMSLRDLLSWGDEIIDLASDKGLDSSTPLQTYWSDAVEPASYPTFLWRMDEEEQIAVSNYLKIV